MITSKISPSFAQRYNGCHNVTLQNPSFMQRFNGLHNVTLQNPSTTSGLSIYCMVLYHSQTRRQVIKWCLPYDRYLIIAGICPLPVRTFKVCVATPVVSVSIIISTPKSLSSKNKSCAIKQLLTSICPPTWHGPNSNIN